MYDKAAARQRQEAMQKQMQETLKSVIETYQEDPAHIAELLAFRDKFYQYSVKNSMLIQSQNPYATYIASFNEWKNKGYSVCKGEKGLKIYVPVKTTFFNIEINGKKATKQLSGATVEEKEKIRTGEYKTYEKRSYRLGTVFDISQTTCPPEDYPKIYQMGYSSQSHAELYNILKKFNQEVQGVSVGEADLSSISLYGTYAPGQKAITISDKLQDTQRLDTLIHEMGHSIMEEHRKQHPKEVPPVVSELEADAVSIMLQTHMGLELTDARKIHFVDHYQACVHKQGFQLETVLNDVSLVYMQFREELDPYKEKMLSQKTLTKTVDQKSGSQLKQDLVHDQVLTPLSSTQTSTGVMPQPDNAPGTSSLDYNKTLVVNLYGGPGAGKTTCAWQIASELKKRGYNVEYVSEYAKELVYEQKLQQLDGTPEHQAELLQEQRKRVDRLIGKVDIVVTDSPIMLNTVYLKQQDLSYTQNVKEIVEHYHNFNLVVERGKEGFQQAGRIHDLSQSQKLDLQIRQMLSDNGMYYGVYNHSTVDVCIKNIMHTYGKLVDLSKAQETPVVVPPPKALNKEKTADGSKVEYDPVARWNYDVLSQLISDQSGGVKNISKLTDNGFDEIYISVLPENEITVLHRREENGTLHTDPTIHFKIDHEKRMLSASGIQENLFSDIRYVGDNIELINELNTLTTRMLEPYQDYQREPVKEYVVNHDQTHVLEQDASRDQYMRTSRGQSGRPLYEASREQLEQLKKEVPILTVAEDLGYHPVQGSGGRWSLEEHDSVQFYMDTNTYTQFSKGEGGSVIDFTMHLGDMEKREAIRWLKEQYLSLESDAFPRQPRAAPADDQKPTEKKPFILPEKVEGRFSRAVAYLVKTRCIDPEVVRDGIRDGLIYEDGRHNVVFVGKDPDGKPGFATRRGTNTEKSFRGDVAGSDQTLGFKVEGKRATRLYVTEAPIDALSVQTIDKRRGYDTAEATYLATCGTGKTKVVERYLQEHPEIREVILANDNDPAGQEANRKLTELIKSQNPDRIIQEIRPQGNDVNEMLQNCVQAERKAQVKQAEPVVEPEP